MLQTLFHIPHELGPLPVFGFGWLLLVWLVFAIGVIVRAVRKQQTWTNLGEQLIFLAIVGGVILYVLPSLEERDLNGEPIGLPIRGYGVMMLLGVISGVALAVQRAQRVGLNPDFIFGLAFWMFVVGIAGARLFYVIEYWDSFQQDTLRATVGEILRFTEGGLVVYGSVIGGLAAATWYTLSRKLPVLAVADLIAPSLVVGLAFGRIGCLLNGCCYGGICEAGLPRLHFPAGSPPYVHQLQHGQLLGMELKRDPDSRALIAVDVAAAGLAAERGIEPGDRFRALVIPPLAAWQAARRDPSSVAAEVKLVPLDDRPPITWQLAQLPRESLAVHPTQLYSALNAVLLFAILWFFYPFRPWDGSVFALLMTLYPISRFLIEIIRTDEPGQWGTALSISQWISLGALVGVALLWLFLARTRPAVTRRFAAI